MPVKKKTTKRKPAKKATARKSKVNGLVAFNRAVYKSPAVRKAKSAIATAEKKYKALVKKATAAAKKKARARK